MGQLQSAEWTVHLQPYERRAGHRANPCSHRAAAGRSVRVPFGQRALLRTQYVQSGLMPRLIDGTYCSFLLGRFSEFCACLEI
jgi:hypothetical protein